MSASEPVSAARRQETTVKRALWQAFTTGQTERIMDRIWPLIEPELRDAAPSPAALPEPTLDGRPAFLRAHKDWEPLVRGEAIGIGNLLNLDASGVERVARALDRARIAGYCRGNADATRSRPSTTPPPASSGAPAETTLCKCGHAEIHHTTSRPRAICRECRCDQFVPAETPSETPRFTDARDAALPFAWCGTWNGQQLKYRVGDSYRHVNFSTREDAAKAKEMLLDCAAALRQRLVSEPPPQNELAKHALALANCYLDVDDLISDDTAIELAEKVRDLAKSEPPPARTPDSKEQN